MTDATPSTPNKLQQVIVETKHGPVSLVVGFQQAQTRKHTRDAFDELMDQQAAELDGEWFYSSIAGVTHRNTDGSSRQSFIRMLSVHDILSLVPEPTNVHHPGAVRLNNSDGQQVGYLHRDVANDVTKRLQQGDGWKCIVAKIHGEGTALRNVRIALLRWSIAQLARPKEDRDFEKRLSQLTAERGGRWMYAQLTHLRKPNEDGTDRRELLHLLVRGEQVQLRPDDEDLQVATRIHLVNTGGQMLGTLSAFHSSWLLGELRLGAVWKAVARNCEESPKFEPFIALVRLPKI